MSGPNISVIAVCDDCGATIRRDPQRALQTSPTDIVDTWNSASCGLAQHRAVNHPPDSRDRLFVDMVAHLKNAKARAGYSGGTFQMSPEGEALVVRATKLGLA